MRMKTSFGVVAVLSAIAAASACGGSTSGGSSCPDGGPCPSGGTAGGGNGGNGGIGGGAVGGTGGIGGGAVGGSGGFGGGGTGGFGGGSPCQIGCDKLAGANCPAPFDHAACVVECQAGYTETAPCAPQYDAVVACVATNGVVSCDGGEPVFINAEQACPNEIDAFTDCMTGTGGAGGVGGTGGMGGVGGTGGAITCGGAICNGWKLGGIINMQPCCAASGGCGALSDSTIEAISGVPQGCYPLNHPGVLECSCPPITFTNPINNELVTFAGCCSNGNCGIQADLTSVQGPNLGCAVPMNEPPKPCAPLSPPPCN